MPLAQDPPVSIDPHRRGLRGRKHEVGEVALEVPPIEVAGCSLPHGRGLRPIRAVADVDRDGWDYYRHGVIPWGATGGVEKGEKQPG